MCYPKNRGSTLRLHSINSMTGAMQRIEHSDLELFVISTARPNTFGGGGSARRVHSTQLPSQISKIEGHIGFLRLCPSIEYCPPPEKWLKTSCCNQQKLFGSLPGVLLWATIQPFSPTQGRPPNLPIGVHKHRNACCVSYTVLFPQMHDQSIQHNITLTTRCGGGAPRATLRLLVDEQSPDFVDFSLLLLLLLFFLSFFPQFLVRMVVLLL